MVCYPYFTVRGDALNKDYTDSVFGFEVRLSAVTRKETSGCIWVGKPLFGGSFLNMK
jgi:hypothetical protein